MYFSMRKLIQLHGMNLITIAKVSIIYLCANWKTFSISLYQFIQSYFGYVR